MIPIPIPDLISHWLWLCHTSMSMTIDYDDYDYDLPMTMTYPIAYHWSLYHHCMSHTDTPPILYHVTCFSSSFLSWIIGWNLKQTAPFYQIWRTKSNQEPIQSCLSKMLDVSKTDWHCYRTVHSIQYMSQWVMSHVSYQVSELAEDMAQCHRKKMKLNVIGHWPQITALWGASKLLASSAVQVQGSTATFSGLNRWFIQSRSKLITGSVSRHQGNRKRWRCQPKAPKMKMIYLISKMLPS